jgi:hypothetical protein
LRTAKNIAQVKFYHLLPRKVMKVTAKPFLGEYSREVNPVEFRILYARLWALKGRYSGAPHSGPIASSDED